MRNPNITGEASPYYLFHPDAHQRIRSSLPNVKLIVLLRNPVDRTYSHYNHERRAYREERSFEDVIDQEMHVANLVTPLKGDAQRFKHRYQSYLARSCYAEQLEYWFRAFPRNQILILRTEDLKTHAPVIFRQVVEFLELPEWNPLEFPLVFNFEYEEMSSEMRTRLIAYFEPHNELLFRLLNRDFEWNS